MQIKSAWRSKYIFVLELISTSVLFYSYMLYYSSAFFLENKSHYNILLNSNFHIYYASSSEANSNILDLIRKDLRYNEIEDLNREYKILPKDFDESAFQLFPYHSQKVLVYFDKFIISRNIQPIYILPNAAAVDFGPAVQSDLIKKLYNNYYRPFSTEFIVTS